MKAGDIVTYTTQSFIQKLLGKSTKEYYICIEIYGELFLAGKKVLLTTVSVDKDIIKVSIPKKKYTLKEQAVLSKEVIKTMNRHKDSLDIKKDVIIATSVNRVRPNTFENIEDVTNCKYYKLK